jgi:hypothetical protein
MLYLQCLKKKNKKKPKKIKKKKESRLAEVRCDVVRPAGLTKENVKESREGRREKNKITTKIYISKRKRKPFPSRHRDGPATNVKRV